MPIPAYCHEFCTGIRSNGDECLFYIRMSSVEKVFEHGPIWKAEDIQLIPQTVQIPDGIYEHLGRAECEAACCYYAMPKNRIIDENTLVAAPEGMYFVVYAEPTSGGMIVWDWGWRPEDKQVPGNPIGWESFGRGKIWPRQS